MTAPPGVARSVVRAIGGWAMAAGVVWLLHGTGRGDLAAPPIGSLGELTAWFDGTEPATAVFAVVRLVALAGAWYLLAVLLLGTLARLFGAGWYTRAADAVTVPVVRRAVVGLLGVGVLPPVDDAATPTETLVVLDAAVPPDTETLIVLDDTASGDGGATLSWIPPRKARTPVAVPNLDAAETWVIEPGEHLWGIAETHLADRWGRPPTTPEITRYWRTVIDHNRTRLLNPADPDLVVPHQIIELPPPGPGPVS